jgi:hypothetical protein
MIRYILLFFACLCIELQADTIEDDYRPKINNEQRYQDLLDDPFNKRFLSVMLDIRSYAGDGGYAVNNLDEFAWCREQGVKALPLMLEVLKREPTPNVGDSGEIWFSLRFKSAALLWIRDFPAGDSQPFLKEVRRQLPEWLERQFAENDSHTGFICDALELLAREGDASDILLIESFLNDANPTNKYNAQKNLAKLKERLAKEPVDKTGSSNKTNSQKNYADDASVGNLDKDELAGEKKSHFQKVVST